MVDLDTPLASARESDITAHRSLISSLVYRRWWQLPTEITDVEIYKDDAISGSGTCRVEVTDLDGSVSADLDSDELEVGGHGDGSD